MTKTQIDVLNTLFTTGPISDNDLQYVVKAKRDHTSWSGIRTRRSELTARGLVKRVGTGTSTSGRKEALWGLTDRGMNAVIETYSPSAGAL